MRNFLRFALLAATFGGMGAGSALAGGMGDPSKPMRERNAICEKQRRGEGPLSPNLCLPELPPGPVYQGRGVRQ